MEDISCLKEGKQCQNVFEEVQKMWSDPLNYKSIVELEQTEDDDELALNELASFSSLMFGAYIGCVFMKVSHSQCADMTGARS